MKKYRYVNVKILICQLVLMLCILAAVPVMAAEGKLGSVQVIVENTTLSKADGAPWTGELVNRTVQLKDSSTMMSCIVEALGTYEQEGAENNYISSINGLAEFDGGSMSGWMGTLNDWFTNEGFASFTVANGRLEGGDIIRVMYTCSYGEDLGSSFMNTDKDLKSLKSDKGTLSPSFSSSRSEYTLTVPVDTNGVILTPEAVNKNFQVRTTIGTVTYKRSETIPVNDGTVITVTVGDPAWPSMTDAADVPAQVYTIRVAVSADPETPVVPDQPILTSIRNTSTGITVTWEPVADVDGYRVYRRIGTGSWTKMMDVTKTSYTNTSGLESGKTYSYRVRSMKDGQLSSYDKNGLSIVRLDRPVITVANKAAGVTVTWSKVDGAESYQVFRKPAGGSYSKIGETSGTTYTNKSAVSGKTYYYLVKAVNGSSVSASSAAKSILRLAVPQVKLTNKISGIQVSWEAVDGAQSYSVSRKTSSGSWEEQGTVTSLSFTDTTAKAGTTYYYMARAISGSAKSSYLTNVKVVRLTAPKASTVKQSNGILVSWSKVTGAKTYAVYRKKGSGSWVKVTETAGTEWTDTTAKSGEKCAYRVRAVNGSSISSYYTTDTVTR